jgi:CHAT domain-containing protein/Tfp pilus assembly protein PilF
VADFLNNFASFFNRQGDLDKAEKMFQRALEIRENKLGIEHTDVALSLSNLGNVYWQKADFEKAEQMFQRALDIRGRTVGDEHQDYANSLNDLAVLYDQKGDFEKAEHMYQRALEVIEKTVGLDNPRLVIPLNNLAIFYEVKADYEKAEPLYRRALAIREKSFGVDHPSVARSLNGLASVYYSKRDYDNAEPLLRRALEIREKKLSPDHPDVARSLNNFGRLYHRKGNYSEAEPLIRRALEIREKTLGPQHPDVAHSRHNLALLYEAQGDFSRAVAERNRAAEINERILNLNLAFGSDRQKHLYLTTFSTDTDAAASLHLRSAQSDPAASRLALLTILRRKGRAVDALSDSLKALSQRLDPNDRELLEQWRVVCSQLATLSLKMPDEANQTARQAKIERLGEEKENLERTISRRSAEFRSQSQPVTIEAVREAMPHEAALVEFFSYFPSDPRDDSQGEKRYVAYVLSKDGEPSWANLGEAKVIDAEVSAFRAALSDWKRGDVKHLARALDEKVMRPVRKLTGDKQWLLIAPDGMLNLIPFAALVDENNRYMVESRLLTYLTSGRDLLWLQDRAPHRQEPLVIANPAFNDAPRAEANTLRGLARDVATNRSTALAEMRESMPLYDLPSSVREADAIKKLFPRAKILTGRQATESALKRISKPLFLHVATHGFFQKEAGLVAGRARELVSTRGDDLTARNVSFINPLLRSGLALAGAGALRGNADSVNDGILTALEVAGLDLRGTKLVVLSACGTGLGEVKSGDGVYGLRRALVLAGAESQVMSLWNVADRSTKELMAKYYLALQRGKGRSEALQQAQLEMLKDDASSHPFYWAGFIQSGQWRELGRIVPESKPAVKVRDRRSRVRN